MAFVGKANCGGQGPISIAVHGNLLYVLNIANITGFRIRQDGSLRAISSSTRFLATVGGRDLGDSDLAFNPDRNLLAVTERVANQIGAVSGRGACWNVLTKDGKFCVLTNAGSSNDTLLLVSELGQLSFHSITSAGSNVAPLDTALTTNGLFLYTLDGAAGSISEFRVDESSQTLTLLGTISDGLTAKSGLQGLAAY